MSSEPWILTIIRLHGLRFLRPEKSWRPIVTVVVDHHAERQQILGCDGQNVNMKDEFHFRDVDVNSRIDVHVWRKSESKKKGKKRQLAATTSLTLGELFKRQGASSSTELRLNCMNSSGKRTSKGQPQSCAAMVVRIRAPTLAPRAAPSYSSSLASDDERMSYSNFSERQSETLASDDETHASIPIIEEPPNQLRRRRVRGYKIDSGEESDVSFSIEEEYPPEQYPYEDDDSSFLDSVTWENPMEDEEERRVYLGPISWIATQVLPRYANQSDDATQPLSKIEAFVNMFSPYKQMVDATTDDDFLNVLDQVRGEWRWALNVLLVLCGLNLTIFALSPDSVFQVDNPAKNAAAISAVCSGIGAALAFWYMFLYSTANGAHFKLKARDTFGSYFFFCLSCRLPAFMLVLASFTLLAFMLIVAFQTWPEAVLVVSFFAGLIMTLQYLAYGAAKIINGIRWIFKKLGVMGARVWRFVTFRGKEQKVKEALAEDQPPPYETSRAESGSDDKKDNGVVVTVQLEGECSKDSIKGDETC